MQPPPGSCSRCRTKSPKVRGGLESRREKNMKINISSTCACIHTNKQTSYIHSAYVQTYLHHYTLTYIHTYINIQTGVDVNIMSYIIHTYILGVTSVGSHCPILRHDDIVALTRSPIHTYIHIISIPTYIPTNIPK